MRILLPCLILIILFSGCKKNGTPQPSADQNDLSQVQSEILGNWYYQSLTASFYIETTDISDETATPADIRALGHFQFSGDKTGAYTVNGQTYSFNYTLKSTNGTDSLICTGGINDRFKIDGVDQIQLSLIENVHQTNILENSSGQKVYSDMVILKSLLSHNTL